MSYLSELNNSGRVRSGNTTLYIKPSAGELSQFSAFGDVDDVSTKSLGVDCHVISGQKVKVSVANDKHQEKTTLLDLNDDCILDILSMKCLSANDLCSVAEASGRLKEIAVRAFKREHKTCDIDSLSKEKMKTAERILMHFGSAVSELKISELKYSEESSRKIWKSVIEHCSTTLQSLELRFVNIPEDLTAELRPLFKNLHKLSIRDCLFKGASEELFENCGSLLELYLEDYDSAAVAFILGYTYPKLQRFKCWDLLESFVSRHMNLKSLTICDYVSPTVFQRIADCKQLQTLECYIRENDTLDLSNLAHLRELDISCNRERISQIALGLNNLQFLQHLTLSSVTIDPELIRTLSQLQQLQVLKLPWCTELQNLNRLGDLSQLTTLKIKSLYSADLDVVLLVERCSKLRSQGSYMSLIP